MKSTGVLKKDRPKAPPRDPKYPTKQDVALSLLKQFGYNFPEIHVQCILTDALYGDKKLNVSQTNLSAMENGRRAIGKELAKRIAILFEVDYRVFL